MVSLDNPMLKVSYQILLHPLEKTKIILNKILLIIMELHQMQRIIIILNSSVKMKAQIKMLILILIKKKVKLDK